jgi:nucleoside-diphosphate-sugar epimerase
LSGKVLLTGGAGFIGLNLAAALVSTGYEIDIIDNLSRGVNDAALRDLIASGKARFHHTDLLTPGALSCFGDDYTIIIHFAAIVGVRNVLERPYQTLRDNILLQEAAIDFAKRQRRLDRLLFASTSEVYAGSLLHLTLPFPTPEDVPLALPSLVEPRTSYMLSKIYGEAMVIQSGVPYTIVRPHNVYGPRMGMAHVVPELLKKAHDAPSGGTLDVFSVDHRRCFCFVDDAVELIRRLLDSDAARDQVLNVGAQDAEVSIQELAAIVADIVGKPLRIVARPATAGSPLRRCPDMSKTKAITGYSARTSLREGVAVTYTWYRKYAFAHPVQSGLDLYYTPGNV